MSQGVLTRWQFGHRARLALSPAEVSKTDDQARAARALWNLLHAWWRMTPREKRTLANADAAIRQAREDIDFLAVLPAQAAQEAWGRTVTLLTYKTARLGGTLVKVPAPGTSRRCSACGLTTPGSRESQAVFVCKNPDCGWSGNADHNAARNVLHLYRTGHAPVPAAGRAVVRRAKRVKPAAAR
ncbi:transposase [Streptomyces sp. CB02400]|uniref:transposase n=1 Tax=unclassified Streptomyces TaxID=2593676 RepID=UPI001F3F1A68|nr:transposase [Streptomyces sp. CB02400]